MGGGEGGWGENGGGDSVGGQQEQRLGGWLEAEGNSQKNGQGKAGKGHFTLYHSLQYTAQNEEPYMTCRKAWLDSTCKHVQQQHGRLPSKNSCKQE